MEERCSRCKTRLFSSDKIVKCPDCGVLYHLRCWEKFTDKCVACGADNENFSDEKIQAYKRAVEEKKFQELSEKEKEVLNSQARQRADAMRLAQENINKTLNNEETGMFANVGEKLKGWAKANFVLGVIFGIITAIAMMSIDDEFIIPGLTAGTMEIAAAWAFSLILYAFGELVSNSKESKKLQQKILEELKNKKE